VKREVPPLTTPFKRKVLLLLLVVKLEIRLTLATAWREEGGFPKGGRRE